MFKNIFKSLSLLSFCSCLFLACGSSGSNIAAQDADNITVEGALALSASSSVGLEAALTGSPTTLNLTVYEFYVSQHSDCTDPVLVSDTETTIDLASSAPRLFSGNIPAGTYPCLILKMSDVMTFRPDSNAETAFPGICDSASNSSFDIYRSDNGDGNPWKDILGNPVSATGTPLNPSNDRVTLYATTVAADAIAGDLRPHTNQVSEITGALQVPGSTTFVVSFPTDAIGASSGACSVEELSIGFE